MARPTGASWGGFRSWQPPWAGVAGSRAVRPAVAPRGGSARCLVAERRYLGGRVFGRRTRRAGKSHRPARPSAPAGFLGAPVRLCLQRAGPVRPVVKLAQSHGRRQRTARRIRLSRFSGHRARRRLRHGVLFSKSWPLQVGRHCFHPAGQLMGHCRVGRRRPCNTGRTIACPECRDATMVGSRSKPRAIQE
jgi:hypothetical protein